MENVECIKKFPLLLQYIRSFTGHALSHTRVILGFSRIIAIRNLLAKDVKHEFSDEYLYAFQILKENLLAALSVQSGIQYDPTEEVMMAARHIADQRQSSSGAGPSHIPRSLDYASSSIPNRMTCVEEDLDHIRHFQAYQVKHNQAVAEMLRTMALHHGMNMDNFPTCPSYIPPRDKAVLNDDDDDDDGDDDDDDDEDEDEEDEE